LAHLYERYGKVNFRLTRSNAAKLVKVAEEMQRPALPLFTSRRITKQMILTHVLNRFLKSFTDDRHALFELVENRKRNIKICIHLDLRMRYALWRASKILKISQNELVNMAIESYALKDTSTQTVEK